MINQAFVTDGKESSTLGVVKSLGKEGVKVVVGDDTRFAASRFSRYCSRFFLYSSPEVDAEQFMEKIFNELKRSNCDMFFLTSDSQMLPVIKYWEELSKHTCMAAPLPDTLMQVFNKALTLKLAQSLSVPIPKTLILTSRDQLHEIKASLSYPLVIKYTQTYYWKGTRVEPAPRVQFVYSAIDLEAKLKEVHFGVQSVLLQEVITGPGIGIFGVFKEGKPCALFAHQRLREANPTGGASAEAMSIALDPVAKEMTCTLMDALKWSGVAMIELKKDEKNGGFKLMEVNGRFWGSLPLALHCNVNFPVLLVEALNGQNCHHPREYPLGLRCRHTSRYLTHLFHTLKGAPRGWEGKYPGRLETLKDFFRFYQKGLSYYCFEKNDPLPELADLLFWIKLNAAKVLRKIRSHDKS